MIKVLNSLPCSTIAINADKEILFVNKFFLNLLGVNEEDIIGKDLFQIISISNYSVDELINSLPQNNGFYFCIKNNKNNYISLFGEIIEDNFNGENAYFIVQKAEPNEQYTKKHLENLLDEVQVECCIKDTNGKYIYVNKRFADALSYDKSQIIGKTSRDFLNKEDSDFLEKKEKKIIAKKKTIKNDNVYYTVNEKRWYNNIWNPIFDDNNDVKYISNCKFDVTLRKFLNDLFQDAFDQINQIGCGATIFNTDEEYETLVKLTIEKIMHFSKADGISIVYFDKKSEELRIVKQTGEVIEELKNKYFVKSFYQFINKLGEGVIKLENIIKDKDFNLLNSESTLNKFSELGIYDMIFDKDYLGFIVLTYKKDYTDRYIPVSYLKTLCSYLSTNIGNWKRYRHLEKEKRKVEKINNSLMNFIDTSEDMIATWDLDGKPIYNNYQISKVLGHTDISKLNFFELLHPDDKTKAWDMMFNGDSDVGSMTSRFKCSDNSSKWLDWNYKILKEENMFFSVGKDVTDRIANEKRKLLVQQAQCIEEIKDEFLYNITHEFRTPINIISSTIQLINSSLENGTYKLDNLYKHIIYLKRNSNRLLRLVNNLIDITYIKNGYHELNLKNHNMVELVENVCNQVIASKENNNMNIIFDTDCEEVIMACDADEIERIVLNLLSNAVKYGFSKEPIVVSIKSTKNDVKISVKDHGIGIPRDYLDAIFEKLTRVDNKLTRHNEGSGIGLAIVKSLVNLHHGTINVESELGKGSNFIITLPISLIDKEEINIENSNDSKNKIDKCAMEFSDIYAYI